MKRYINIIIIGFSLLFIAISCKHLAVESKPKVQYSQAEKQAFLDTLENRTFHYFWDLADPNTGLIPDRAPTKSFSSIAATGFGLTADVIGVKRGYVTRNQAANRILKTLKFFWNAPKGPQATDVTGYHGFYYHFLDMSTGKRFKNVELSTIDTTWLLAGILVSRDYFDGSSPEEQQIRALADSINNRVDWKWFTKSDSLVSMGWHPESGFLNAEWKGYNEGSFLYVLALGSPTHPLGPLSWKKWTAGYDWASYYGYQAVQFGPLFGHQYSQMFVNYKGIQDAYMKNVGSDYFENSKRATLAQIDYAKHNPMNFVGYGNNVWGLTACDGPANQTVTWSGNKIKFHTYTARGEAANYDNDDGTIAPTAAGGSIPFTPDQSITALMYMKDQYPGIWGKYGFKDSFNATYPKATGGNSVWYDKDYLGIDQGPILIMAENYRSGMIWKLLEKDPVVIRGLKRSGFKGGWLQNTTSTIQKANMN
jgi:hypothetical protein